MAEETYGHTPSSKMFGGRDVYGIGYDPARAARRSVRCAIIGAGGVAQAKYLPALARLGTLWEPVELVAVAEPRSDHAQKLEHIYGGHWYADYQQMLGTEQLDAVLVLSPDALHAEHTLAALEAGLAVLVEKPFATSLSAAKGMCARADELGLPLLCVANKRLSPPYRRAHQLIADGPVHHPALCTAKFNLGYDYVDLFEAGTVHLFDLMRYLMGDVQTVYALGVRKYDHNRTGYPVDNAVISFEFTSGGVGTLSTSSTALSLKPWERVEVYAEGAWLAVDDQYTLTLYDDELGPAKSWTPVIPNTLLFDTEWGGYLPLIENFLQVVRGNAQPIAVGWDGYHALELIAASHLSLARREQVQLPLDPAVDAEVAMWRAGGGCNQ